MGNVTETDAAIISDAELDIPWVKLDKEISDVLIAISVITRQLAKKNAVNHMSKEAKDDEGKRIGEVI